MADYSICYDDETEKATQEVRGNLHQANFEANKMYTSLDKVREALEAGTQVWDLPYLREKYRDDDYESDGDEDDDEGEGEGDYDEEYDEEEEEVKGQSASGEDAQADSNDESFLKNLIK